MRLTPDLVRTLEAELAQIRNVSFCGINLNADGTIDNIDVISDTERAPQRVVRDVEIILRRHGVDIDHRKIGVVQMQRPDRVPSPQSEPATESPHNGSPSTPSAQPAVLQLVPESERCRLAAVHSTTRDGTFSVEVELTLGSYEGVPGRAEGPGNDPASCVALVAAATLEAVRNLLQPRYEALVREARVLDVGGASMVLVVVDFGPGRKSRRLAGICIQSGSLYDAAVYATLDAINRPLGRADFRQVATLEEAEAFDPGESGAAQA